MFVKENPDRKKKYIYIYIYILAIITQYRFSQVEQPLKNESLIGSLKNEILTKKAFYANKKQKNKNTKGRKMQSGIFWSINYYYQLNHLGFLWYW